MATTQAAAAESTLQDLAKRHLWMHFSRMGAYGDGADIPIIVKGDGCYVWDEHGNKYLNRVFFTSGGSESVETALKLARQYHRLRGNPNKHKVVAREIAYHGATLGALSATGITALRQPFE